MRFLIILSVFLLPLSVKAQTNITVSGTSELTPIVQTVAETLPAPLQRWRIVILNDAQWQTWEHGNWISRGNSRTAFSLLGTNSTYLSSKYVQTHTQERIRTTLAHELGHLICNCSSEDKADSIARKLLRQ